jgi:beta-glucosidase
MIHRLLNASTGETIHSFMMINRFKKPARMMAIPGLACIVANACSIGTQPDETATAHTAEVEQTLINPVNWPGQTPPLAPDMDMALEIERLLSVMTLEEKVGQVIQADIAAITPEDIRTYKLGSILNGGSSAPGNDPRSPPQAWLSLADEFWKASTDNSHGGVAIPLMWGTDAVHGHNNIIGATIFPHNIGLGAANDPDLLEEIGGITALEVRTTGLDWTFAPTLTVVRDDRWGRSYEGYSEDPEIVASYASRFVEGLQGKPGTEDFLGRDRIIATAKHFVGDGGTVDGIDQGDNRDSEVQLRDIHAAGYPPAIAAGVQTVMASFSSFHGRKMHGFREMLNDVLVERMGFDGFVIGDWDGHGQLPGCTRASCPDAFNAGLDVFMAPKRWKALYHNTLEQVRSGEIATSRLDQAVARVLRVKMRAGVFDQPMPSARPHAGNWELLGAPAHRAVAREAVRKSLVLLKNENRTLPIAANSKVLVTGRAAQDIGMQSGGWTLSWQGTENQRHHFPNGTSIFEGITQVLEANGGSAVLSPDGSWQEKPDVAIVVYGEQPYAEYLGDRESVDYEPGDGLLLLRQLREQGIPTVSVFISGRPLWTNPEINASDAFVAAWLPGTEGAGIADVLIAGENGKPRYDFAGRLSFSWPARADQTAVNRGDSDQAPQFEYGYGLTYDQPSELPLLSEVSGLESLDIIAGTHVLRKGKLVGPWMMVLLDKEGEGVVSDSRGTSPAGNVTVEPKDNLAQEDTLFVNWSGPGALRLHHPESTPGDGHGQLIELHVRVVDGQADKLNLKSGHGSMDLTSQVNGASMRSWRRHYFETSCFSQTAKGEFDEAPLEIAVDGKLSMQIASIRFIPVSAVDQDKLKGSCPGE